MSDSQVSPVPLHTYALWDRLKKKRALVSFEIELTARCNNDCRHCYNNLPASDMQVQHKEIGLDLLDKVASEAVSLGALWVLITGGEPLLRKDFSEIYLMLKKKGLLVSLFTNATLLTPDHITLFRKYPPRDIEVSVYGVTRETYEAVTRKPGSFAAFQHGLDLLLHNGLKVRLKAMALRSNKHELPKIAEFCRSKTKDYFRFDPFLHLRLDYDQNRNEEIIGERLEPEEIIALERSDPERFRSLQQDCDTLITPEVNTELGDHLFYCGAGLGSFYLSYDGSFRLCCSLTHPECLYDLRSGNLREAWSNFVPQVRSRRSQKKQFLDKCRACRLLNLCLWCPAHAYLEMEKMDEPVPYFCKIAHERAKMIQGPIAAQEPNSRQ